MAQALEYRICIKYQPSLLLYVVPNPATRDEGSQRYLVRMCLGIGLRFLATLAMTNLSVRQGETGDGVSAGELKSTSGFVHSRAGGYHIINENKITTDRQ